jgi:eukaryotic-like serine/threonine-protein kinase
LVASAAVAHDLVLGRYRPIKPLGSGGMGHVWLARDERSGLDVALKIVAREGKGGHRAEREARAAAALRHPRCQRILSLARDPSHVYIAYEYVPGRTLREVIRAGELDDRGAIEAAAQVCEALAHAHGRGIVHRDVKPSNVLLAQGPTAQSNEIDARLLDFGLAQMAEFDTLTALGDIPGTLAYISPERLQGEEATPAADVWAVGVVLWEALAGEHPFWGGDLVDTSQSIKRGAPPLEALRPDLPDHVLATVASALVAAPQRRPAAGRLAEELRSLPKRRRRKSGGAGGAASPRDRALALVDGVVPASLAGLTAGWVASSLPFFPAGWPLGLAAAGTVLGFAAPRAALLLALAVPVLPLGNVSLGLAAVYALVAACWAILNWRDARFGLLFAAGPLLAPLGGLALLPLVAQGARGRVRRAAQAGAGVLVTAVVAGLRHTTLPFVGTHAPLGLGIDGSRSAGAVAYALLRQLSGHPALTAEAAVLAAAAVLLPRFRGRGPWLAVFFGGGLLAATALVAPSAGLLSLTAAAWLTAGALALHPRN